MRNSKKIWMNGKLLPFANAKVHVLTHGLHYSSAVFEGIRCYRTAAGPAIFRLPEHVERLFQSAKLYSMKIPYTKRQVADAVAATVRASGLQECYIRPIAYLGCETIGLTPSSLRADLSISCMEWKTARYVRGRVPEIKCMVSSWLKIDSRSQPMHAKSAANYSNAILARSEAIRGGFDEALFLNYEGHVVEGAAENLFLVRDGRISTPPLSSGALEGITRDSVIELAEESGEYVREESLDRADLYVADEAFVTGTASEIKAVTQVDSVKIGSGKAGPVSKKLHAQFMEAALGRNEKFLSWLYHI